MPRYTPADIEKIKSWDQNQKNPVAIQLILPENNDPQNNIVSNFLSIDEQLKSLAPKLKITTKTEDTKRPGFKLSGNILFSAFPVEKELPPFLRALSLLDKTNPDTPDLTDTIKREMDNILLPVRLKLYIALFCPHCPKMVDLLIPMALHCDRIRLDIVDGSLFDTEASDDRILSAPCLILDNDFRWTGEVTAGEIIEMAVDRDPANLSMDTLKTIMEQGDAAWIARQMIEKKRLFDAFVQLLYHPTWSVRLGAMVIVEELASSAPDLAGELYPRLIEGFDSSDVSIQGDLLYALGETGSHNARQWIEERMNDFSHPDLLDAALDALEALDNNPESSPVEE